MVNVQTLLLPPPSLAVFVTVITPIGKEKPLGGRLTKLFKPQLSVAVTTKETALAEAPGAAVTMIFVGHEIRGACVSLTVTLNAHVELFPCASVAVLVTV